MRHLIFTGFLALLVSCVTTTESETTENDPKSEYTPLPYFGFHDVDLKVDEDGNQYLDSIYYQVPDYEFINQDSVTITSELTDGKVYVANFFFTSCRSICPSMMEHMKILQEKTSEIDELLILSHTIDPERDSLAKLRQYIVDREIDSRNWHLLYNDREYTHYLGNEGYMLTIMDSDEDADDGFLHSEYFVLVDRDRHIRGMYNGTITEEVDQLAEDIKALIKYEYN